MKFLSSIILTLSIAHLCLAGFEELDKRALTKTGLVKYEIIVRNRTDGQKFREDMFHGIRVGLSMVHIFPAFVKVAPGVLKLQTLQYAKKMNNPKLAKPQIRDFIKALSIDMTNYADPDSYRTFNEFFYRKFNNPNARPIASPNDQSVLVSSADCRLNVFNSISDATNIWIKGKNFNVASLLKNETLAQRFNRGSIAIFRLAPQDYHRFHSPVDGTVISIVDIPGKYYSVNPLAVCTELDVFTENRRVVSLLESEAFGQVAFVSIGATLVGSINFTGMKKGAYVKRGDELGYFAYGGSTVAVLFEPGRVLFDEDLVAYSFDGVESLVRVGERVGLALQPSL